MKEREREASQRPYESIRQTHPSGTARPLTRYEDLEDTPNARGVLAFSHLVQAHKHLSNAFHLLAKDMDEIAGALRLSTLQKPELIVDEQTPPEIKVLRISSA